MQVNVENGLARRNRKLRVALLVAAVAAIVMALGYVCSSAMFARVGPMAMGGMLTMLARGGAGLWLSALGMMLWVVACVLVVILSGDVFLRIGAGLCGLITLGIAAYTAYLAIDYRNVFMVMRYGIDLSRMLVRYLPQITMAAMLGGVVLFLVGLIIRAKSWASGILSGVGILFALVGALLILLRIGQALAFWHYAAIMVPLIWLGITNLVTALVLKTR